MSDRKRILISSILVLAGGMFCATAVTITILYHEALDHECAELVGIAREQARYMESVVRFDGHHRQDHRPGGATDATASQIAAAHRHRPAFGETGELVVAQREGDQIVFLFPDRQGVGSDADPVPWESALAGPMRLALSGQEGTLVGLDYRGKRVLAAYHPVAMLDMGVVAKSDLAEIRAPFVAASAVAGGVTILLVLVGVGLTLRVTDPMVRRLQKDEERLRLTLDAVSDGGWDWNIATGEVRYSDRWLESLGYKRDEVSPHISFWESIVHPDDLPHLTEILNAHIDGRTPTYECENRLRTASGEYRWNLDRGSVVARDGAGKPLRMVGTDTDITERKRIEAKSRESESRYRDLFESANDVILLVDSRGDIIDINRRGEELTGFSKDELLRSNVLRDLIIPEDREKIKQVLRELLDRQNQLFDVRWQAKDGSVIVFEGSSSPRISEDGTFQSSRCILRNVTRRRRREVELAATVDDLRRFDRLTVGREERMIELKREVNEMARKAGIAPPYNAALVEAGHGGTDGV